MSDCIFCKIVAGEIPSQKVYENDSILVFQDIHPVAPTHLLLIPKRHVDNICDPNLEDDLLPGAIFSGIRELSARLGLRENGFRVIVNYGRDAGEAVPHLHLHLLAGRQLAWPPG